MNQMHAVDSGKKVGKTYSMVAILKYCIKMMFSHSSFKLHINNHLQLSVYCVNIVLFQNNSYNFSYVRKYKKYRKNYFSFFCVDSIYESYENR